MRDEWIVKCDTEDEITVGGFFVGANALPGMECVVIRIIGSCGFGLIGVGAGLGELP